MSRYVLHRLALFAPTLMLVTMTVFTVMRIIPGNVAVLILAGPGGENHFTSAEVKRVESELGLNQPIPVQYLHWVKSVATLNFGKSVIRNAPVATEVMRRFLQVTLELAILTVIFALIIAIPSGVLQALYQGSPLDYVLRFVTIAGIAMPSFLTGSLVIIFLVRVFHWLPPIAFTPIWAHPWSNLQQMVVPALMLGYVFSAATTRMVRSSLLEVLRQDYIRTARAKGLATISVVGRHALRNSMLPVITIIGAQVGGLLGGTVIVETLFNLPGVGATAISAIGNHDYPTVEFIVLLYALVFMCINLLVDLSYGWIDPRIRYD